jgi:hypothetical protein
MGIEMEKWASEWRICGLRRGIESGLLETCLGPANKSYRTHGRRSRTCASTRHRKACTTQTKHE